MSGLARYRVLRPIRDGGAFDVLEAVVLGAGDFERRVALKRVRKEDEGVDEANQAILTEARLAGRLRHANIVATIDAGLDEEGLAYLVMDYVDGLDAAALWKLGQTSGRPMPSEVAAHLVTEVAHALDYVHTATDREGRALSIVHRDVTPANVMVSWSGDVLLTDFGIARGILREQRTAAGLSKGTLDFMAPEQITGGHIDLRADVYGLGALLHWLLTGRSPTHGLDMAARARGQRVLDAAAPTPLQRMVLRATSPQRAERYARAGELAQDVWRAGLSAPAGGGRAALSAWLSSLRAVPSAAASPAVASLFALDLASASGVLGSAPLHLGTAVHARPPTEHSSMVSFAEGEDASTAEADGLLDQRTDLDVWHDPITAHGAAEDATDAAMTVRGGHARLLSLDGDVHALLASAPLHLPLPGRLAEPTATHVARTRVVRPPRGPAHTPTPLVPSDEELVRRVSEPPAGAAPGLASRAHDDDGGDVADFGPAATETAALPARGNPRPAYVAGLASGVVLAIVLLLAARVVLAPPEPLSAPAVPQSAAPTPSPDARAPHAVEIRASESPSVTPREGPSPSAPPRSSDAPVVASPSPPAVAPSGRRGPPTPSARPPPRAERGPATEPPAPPPPRVSAAPVSASARLDALGRRLKSLSQAGAGAEELQALESEYFRLRRVAPRTPEEEQTHARAVEALWLRAQSAGP